MSALAGSVNPMVRYYSDDGVLDAPLNKVWKLIEAHGEHATEIHTNLVSAKASPKPDGTMQAEWVTKGPDGKNATHKLHMAIKAPFSQTVDFTDGPLKGSWMTTTYIAEGNKTRCITAAEWRVQGITDPAALLKAATEFFDGGFEADSRYLKTMK